MANKVFYITLRAGQGEIKCNGINVSSDGNILIVYGAEIPKEEVIKLIKKGIIEIGINNIYIPWKYIRIIDVEVREEEVIIDGSLL